MSAASFTSARRHPRGAFQLALLLPDYDDDFIEFRSNSNTKFDKTLFAMTQRAAQIGQAISFYVFWLNPFHGLLKKWSAVMPQGWDVLPYLINFLIIAFAGFFIFCYSSPYQKFSVWLMPILVSGLALLTYLRW